MSVSNVSETKPHKEIKQGGAYAWFVVAVLCLAAIISYVDRQVINLLVDPIKADLGINDTQIGLLQGLSFVIIYVVVAIPLAWLADNGRRTTIIIGGVVCWSLATFSCGLATSFILLFVARAFVGMGEATLTPAGYSLIGDYFPKERVSLAISIFIGAGFVGSGIALMIGGAVVGALSGQEGYTLPFLGEFKPWQLVFMIVAMPGLLLALLFLLVKEPPRRSIVETETASSARDSFVALFRYMGKNSRLFGGITVGFSLMVAANFAIGSWVPTYLDRVHGWETSFGGPRFGLVQTIAAPTGVLVGGVVSSILMKRGLISANLWVPMASAILAIPFAIFYAIASTPELAIYLLFPAIFFCAMPFGCGTATLPLIAPNRLRAQVVAIYLFVANLLGFTLGPTGIGLMTDFVFRDEAKIGEALAIFAPALLLLGALIVSVAIAPYRKVILEAESASSLDDHP